MSVTARLDSWHIVPGKKGKGRALRGIVYRHPFQRDGATVTTSDLVTLDVDGLRAKCLSREYELGIPDQAWVKALEAEGHKLWDFDTTKTKEKP